MLRCGFGLKDAPRLWNKVLRQLLLDLGLRPLQSDEQLFVWHENEHKTDGGSDAIPSAFAQSCRLILSTHVDDLKGAGDKAYRDKLLDALQKKFGQLELKYGQFECIGVMHEQTDDYTEVWCHQQHYVPQIKDITISGVHSADDEEEADEDMKQLYMSLVGALAWLILTMPAICVYVAFLQRHTKAPTVGHVEGANRLLKWIRKNLKHLGVRYRRLREPLRLVALSDSAFKALDYEGLVMRGCVIVLAEAVPEGDVGSDAHRHGPWSTGTTVRLHLLDWYSRKHTRVVRSTFAAELLSLLDAVNQGNVIRIALNELHSGAKTAQQLLAQRPEQSILMDAGVDARSVFDALTADVMKTPNDKALLLHAKAMREILEEGCVDRLFWFDTEDMVPDGLTKGSVDRKALLHIAGEGVWVIAHDEPQWKSLRRDDGQESQ